MVSVRTIVATAVIALALSLPTATAAVGSFGTIAAASTPGLSGRMTGTFATAQIVYQDTANAGILDPTEPVFLDLSGNGAIETGEIQLSSVGPGAAGSSVTTPIAAGSLATMSNAVALTTRLRIRDVAPDYNLGGPDGRLNPTETLFLDITQDNLLSNGDLILSGTSPGSRQASADTDSVWNGGTECVYQATASAVAVGMRRLTACPSGPYAAGSAVATGDADIGVVLTTLSGVVISQPTSRSVTDGVTTASSTTVTSATAAFVAGDVGSSIAGGSIPAGAWITAVNSGTSVTISAAASTTATAVALTIDPNGARTVPGGSTTLGSAVVTTAAPAFSAADVGRTISGTGISGTIIGFTSTTSVTVSAVATATGAGVSLSVGSGSGIFVTGQNAWIGSGTVASGHYRLTGTPDTVVDCVASVGHAADADCGRTTTTTSAMVSLTTSTYPTLAFPAVRWIDLDGNAVFGTADRLYFDIDGNSFAGPADVRINSGGSATFGSRPILGDIDSRAALMAATFNTAQAIYLDEATGTVGTLDSTEAVALDLDGDTHFDYGDIPVSGSCTIGAPRTPTTTCSATGTWKAVAAPTLVLCYHDEGAAGATRGDGVYVHVGATCGPVAGNDVRVSESIISGTSYTGGQRVPTTGSDIGATLAAVTLGTTFTIRAYDADGSQSFSVGDGPYLELGAGDSLATAGDVRLHNLQSLTFGRVLGDDASADKDVVLRFTPITPTFAFHDLDGSGGTLPSVGDIVYMRPSGAACGTIVANDVRLNAGISGAVAGSSVAGSTELGRACTDLGSARFAFSPSSQPYSSTASVVLDTNGDNLMGANDIGISGTAVTTATPLSPITLGAALAPRAGLARVSHLDFNGNGVIDSSEAIILDADGDTYYSTGDMVLVGGAGTPPVSGGGGGGGSTPVVTPTTTTTATTTSASTTTSVTQTATTTSQAPTSTQVPTASSTTSVEVPSSTETTSQGLIPGFELVALVAALAVALMAIRRRLA